VEYVQPVSRKRQIVRKYWFDGAIALLAIVGLIEFAIRDEQSSSPWFAVLAVGTLVFLIVARRRFPFAAPAAYWVVASAVAFVDAVLLPSIQSLFVVGWRPRSCSGTCGTASRPRPAWLSSSAALS
jgi:hypothetical protein